MDWVASSAQVARIGFDYTFTDMKMDLKRLRYFVTVARLGSFTRAAEELRMAQPPLSQRVQELEAEVGAPLLDRDSRPLVLTPAGRLLYDQAVQVLQKTEAMVTSMRRLLSDERAVFNFGVVPANFHSSLASIIREYRRVLPGVEARILELNSLEQVDALRTGRIDAGISRVEVPAEGIRRIVLREEPMVVALPSDHPLATLEEAMPLAALKDEPFIVYASNPRPSLADHVLAQFESRGVTLSRTIEIDQYDTALILIAAGTGVSIVPASARLVTSPGVAYRPLVEHIASPIIFCHREDDASSELRALYFALAQFLTECGHPVPKELKLRADTALK
ncbi:LysR substrate-binding domain-containing protein [Halotalea alkalilenta]|uniref:LysR substrate-binding domain-containing protein n=1 Tax=Halotalea alkalilenta TaxID=376489 RepID=UPI0009DF3431